MGKYILRRVAQMLVTLLIFQTLLFLILTAMPGDIANRMLANPEIPPEARERLREALGLNDPPLVRFGRWFGSFLTGDLGESLSEYPTPVIEILAERIPRTMVLFLSATVVNFVVGFYMGRVLAWQRGGFVEYSSTIVGVSLFTVFTPWFGLMMVFIFGARLKWLPLGKFLTPEIWSRAEIQGLADSASKANFIFGRLLFTATIVLALWILLTILVKNASSQQRRGAQLGGAMLLLTGAVVAWSTSDLGVLAWDIIKHMILPVVTITLAGFAGTMLITRQTMLETLREDYIQTARAKGVPEKTVRDKHAARNALLPVFTNLIIRLPFVLSGGIITETIFSWPGMGLTLLNATNQEDIPLVMGTLSFIGVLSLAAHLLADITYAFLDPRIRYD